VEFFLEKDIYRTFTREMENIKCQISCYNMGNVLLVLKAFQWFSFFF